MTGSAAARVKEVATPAEGTSHPVAQISLRVELGADGTQKVYVPKGVDVHLASADTRVFGPDNKLVTPQLSALAEAANDELPESGQALRDGTIYVGRTINDRGEVEHWARVPNELIKVMNWLQGQDYAQNLTFGDHKDWKQPSEAVGRLMYNDRARVFGDFKLPDSWLWLGRSYSYFYAYSQSFDNGGQDVGNKGYRASVCPVRLLAVSQQRQKG